MSDDNQQSSDTDLNNEVFQVDDDEQEEETGQQQNDQWINELRTALERGCDLGAIRNIGKCRALTGDLRLAVWKVSRLSSLFALHRSFACSSFRYV